MLFLLSLINIHIHLSFWQIKATYLLSPLVTPKMVLLLKGHPFPNTLHSDLGILVICNRNHLLFLPSFCGSKNILVPNLWGVAPGAFPVGKKITPVDKLGHFRCLYINVFLTKRPTHGRTGFHQLQETNHPF